MKNMMKEYLGNEYSNNHLRNFCLYWIKAFECRDRYASDDEWRKENDLDCLYLDGDLRADTLMSAWTPIKWVADCLNSDIGIVFYKKNRTRKDPYHDLRLLAKDTDVYLPPEHELVKLLNRFLELAELRCNFILLPSREMNTNRYQCRIGNEKIWLCDEVPATLAHLFDKQSLGRYFPDSDSVAGWIRSEHLEMGFEDGKIDICHVRPFIEGLDPYAPKWLTEENEISQALIYMIDFLKTRKNVLSDIEKYGMDMSYRPGSSCYISAQSGYNKVARSIGEAFRKVVGDTPIDNIDLIDFQIKGDISYEESVKVEGCIKRLCKWYGGDKKIPVEFKCRNDETKDGTCSTCAILCLKDDGRLRKKEKDLAEKEELIRPKGITSNVLWEIYKLFHSMYRPYLWVDMDKKRNGKYNLYQIVDAVFGFGETDYGIGNMGIELPWSRKEWIDLKLVSAYGDSGTISKQRIGIDAITEDNKTIEEVLKMNHMKLPEGIG